MKLFIPITPVSLCWSERQFVKRGVRGISLTNNQPRIRADLAWKWRCLRCWWACNLKTSIYYNRRLLAIIFINNEVTSSHGSIVCVGSLRSLVVGGVLSWREFVTFSNNNGVGLEFSAEKKWPRQSHGNYSCQMTVDEKEHALGSHQHTSRLRIPVHL